MNGVAQGVEVGMDVQRAAVVAIDRRAVLGAAAARRATAVAERRMMNMVALCEVVVGCEVELPTEYM